MTQNSSGATKYDTSSSDDLPHINFEEIYIKEEQITEQFQELNEAHQNISTFDNDTKIEKLNNTVQNDYTSNDYGCDIKIEETDIKSECFDKEEKHSSDFCGVVKGSNGYMVPISEYESITELKTILQPDFSASSDPLVKLEPTFKESQAELESSAGPSSEIVVIPPVQPYKHCQGKALRSGEKYLAFNLYLEYIKNKKVSKTQCVKMAAIDVGISNATMWHIIRDMERTNVLSSPPRQRNRKIGHETLNEDNKKQLRSVIDNICKSNETPTINKIHKVLQNDKEFPTLSRASLHRYLKKLGFRYEYNGKIHYLTEKYYGCVDSFVGILNK